MARRWCRGAELLGGDRPGGRRRVLQPAEPVERIERRQSALPGRGPRPGSSPPCAAASRRTGRTARDFDHSALAVVCTSTTQPSPRFSAVTSGVPSARRAQVLLARSRSGSARTCRDHRDIGRDGEPGETGSRRRTARAWPAFPRTARRRGCARRGAGAPAAGGRSARRAAARRRATAGPPASTHFLMASSSPANPARHRHRPAHRDFPLQQVAGAAAPHFGERAECALEIVTLAEQRLSGGIGGRPRCRPAAAASARRPARPRRPKSLALDLDAGDAVAQLGRERQAHHGAGVAGRDRRRFAGQKCANPRRLL